jgi:hypothetical protein
MDNDVPPEQRWRRGDRLRVAWTRIRLVGETQDTETVVYANLSDRDDIEEVKFDSTRWFKGTVRKQILYPCLLLDSGLRDYMYEIKLDRRSTNQLGARKFAVVFICKTVPGQLTEDARRFF